MMLSRPDKFCSLVESAAIQHNGLGPSSEVVVCLEHGYLGFGFLFEYLVGCCQSRKSASNDNDMLFTLTLHILSLSYYWYDIICL